jgi:predicted HAD superfamily Cof-like phosphohydrolase
VTPKYQHVQAGVHFEEVGEMLDALSPIDPQTSYLVDEANKAIKALASHLKTTTPMHQLNRANDVDMIDSLCDQIVTAIGVAHSFDYNIAGALWEVDASNWSKFVDGRPLFDSNGKIAKGPDYFKANLENFVV